MSDEFEQVQQATRKARSWAWMNKGKVALCVLLVVIVVGGALFRMTCVTFVDNYALGFTYDRFEGKIEALDRTGYIVRWPVKYTVHAIDVRPYQINITANIGSGSRVLNAKLVKFNPAGLQTFVSWHGREAGDSLSNLQEIMKCYAFDKEGGKDCPFITVLNEINPSQTPSQSGSAPATQAASAPQAMPVGTKP